MLRLLIVAVIAFAAIWFFTKDAGRKQAAFEEQQETLENAREATQALEDASAAAAAQADAVRDAMPGSAQPQDGQ